jgi:four helix bundle protein
MSFHASGSLQSSDPPAQTAKNLVSLPKVSGSKEIERGMGMFKFEGFDVWKRAIEFADRLFDVANDLPQKYQFSLGEQMRQAALSIPTNLAEGSGRDNPKEERYFYGMAKGSVYEVVSLLVMIGKRGCLTQEVYREHYGEADERQRFQICGNIAHNMTTSQQAATPSGETQ